MTFSTSRLFAETAREWSDAPVHSGVGVSAIVIACAFASLYWLVEMNGVWLDLATLWTFSAICGPVISPSPFAKRAFSSSVIATSGLMNAEPLFKGSRETITNRALVTVRHSLCSESCWSTSMVASIEVFPTQVTCPRSLMSASCCDYKISSLTDLEMKQIEFTRNGVEAKSIWSTSAVTIL